MHSEFMEALENSPVIAAVKDDDGLKKCLETDSSIVFILYGDICNIPQIVETVKSAGKIAMVHVDLIHGLSPKEIAIDFIHQYTKADGIISTKALLIKRAGELGLYTIHRFFVIDSMAYESISKTMRTGNRTALKFFLHLCQRSFKNSVNPLRFRSLPAVWFQRKKTSWHSYRQVPFLSHRPIRIPGLSDMIRVAKNRHRFHSDSNDGFLFIF